MSGRAAQLAIELSERGASDVAGGLDRVTGSARDMGNTVDSAARQTEQAASKIDTTAESADELASKGAQAAGAMGGLGSLIGGPFGAAMQTGGVALQAAADSGDLLNAALENSVVASARSKAATIGKTIADKASAAATRATTVAQKALNLAQRASPIGLIITGVLLLVGALVLAYKHSATFRAIVQSAMRLAGAAIDKVVGVFKGLPDAAHNAVDGVQNRILALVGFITDKAGAIKDKFVGAWQGIEDKGKAAFDRLTAPIQAIVDLVQGLLDKIASIHIPHVDVNPFNKVGGGFGFGASTGHTSTGDTITIPTTITGGASTEQAADWMQAVDRRLRSLGKRPVFS